MCFRGVSRPSISASKRGLIAPASPDPAQIMINHENGHTGQLASITTMLNFLGATVRILTTIQEVSSNVPPRVTVPFRKQDSGYQSVNLTD